jgi:hypothetical protein
MGWSREVTSTNWKGGIWGWIWRRWGVQIFQGEEAVLLEAWYVVMQRWKCDSKWQCKAEKREMEWKKTCWRTLRSEDIRRVPSSRFWSRGCMVALGTRTDYLGHVIRLGCLEPFAHKTCHYGSFSEYETSQMQMLIFFFCKNKFF